MPGNSPVFLPDARIPLDPAVVDAFDERSGSAEGYERNAASEPATTPSPVGWAQWAARWGLSALRPGRRQQDGRRDPRSGERSDPLSDRLVGAGPAVMVCISIAVLSVLVVLSVSEPPSTEEEPVAAWPRKAAPPSFGNGAVPTAEESPSEQPDDKKKPSKSAEPTPSPTPKPTRHKKPGAGVTSAPPRTERPALAYLNAASSHCLDLRYGYRDPGTQLQIYNCHGSENQQFTYTETGEFRVFEDLCMTSTNGASRGSPVVADPCDGGSAQQWHTEADGTVRQAGLCLDVLNEGRDPETPVQLWDCGSAENQRWLPTVFRQGQVY
ncbi:RICIN domain-containing protein [Streptomyces sp. NPDC002055]|uniref:RICIN domain-containing protein n=1 Tax=Streptomyces sp. NPDC002055 TaxID=3154534 RepID=UPI00332E6805